MPAASFYRSPDATPLCASCAWSTIPWPAQPFEWMGDDKCGAGVISGGRTQRQCFSYEGTRGELVTITDKPVTDTAWQDRTDGMRIRKPK